MRRVGETETQSLVIPQTRPQCTTAGTPTRERKIFGEDLRGCVTKTHSSRVFRGAPCQVLYEFSRLRNRRIILLAAIARHLSNVPPYSSETSSFGFSSVSASQLEIKFKFTKFLRKDVTRLKLASTREKYFIKQFFAREKRTAGFSKTEIQREMCALRAYFRGANTRVPENRVTN